MKIKRFVAFLGVGSLVLTSFGADYEQAVTALIPRLADPVVRNRYAAEMELQDIASNSSRPGNETERAAAGKVLAAKAADASVPQPARVWIVRQLQYMGGAEAVPALTQLLGGEDAELRECARRALEKNPAPEASHSLWNALQKVATDKGSDAIRWKIGLMNSLAERRDTAAVGLIAPRLREEETAGAAALALGKIANAAAVDALWAVFPQNRFAGEALVEAANRLGRQEAAGAICQRLYNTSADSGLRSAALVTLAKSSPPAAAKLIPAALTGNDTRLQLAAVTAATAAYGSKLSQNLAPLLPQLAPAAKARVLAALDASAEKEVIASAADSDEAVRRAAFEALGRIGSGACVVVLLEAASDTARPGKSTAATALMRINGPGAAAAIRKAASAGPGTQRAVAIAALASRRDTTALAVILECTGDADADVKKAAFAALGTMGTESELEALAKMAVAGKSPEASAALEAVASRATDKPAAAKKLLAAAGADEQALAGLVDALSALGGDDALAAATRLAANSDEQTRDAAIRALGNWPDFAAVKPLMTIAGGANAKLSQYVLAMQGIARLVKSAENEPAQARVDVALAAMESARRDDERKLMLSALGSVPHARAAAAIEPLLSDAKLKSEAGAAALSLAEALRRTDRKTSRDLAQAVQAANISDSLNQRARRLIPPDP